VVYGNPETTTGGNALKFCASVRLDIRKIGTIKNGEQIVGTRTRVKVVKNKVAPTVSRGGVWSKHISKPTEPQALLAVAAATEARPLSSRPSSLRYCDVWLA
jgi:hypothetical protein